MPAQAPRAEPLAEIKAALSWRLGSIQRALVDVWSLYKIDHCPIIPDDRRFRSGSADEPGVVRMKIEQQ
jgi:hypothetical protein